MNAKTTFGLLIAISAAGNMLCKCPTACADNLQEQFFAAVAKEDPEALLSLCRDDMRDVIDEPVLTVWMQAFNLSMGTYRGMSSTDFTSRLSFVNGVRQRLSEGEVIFERGSATSRIVTENGKIISWQAKSDKMPSDWFKGPSDTKLYRRRGERFVTQFCTGQADVAFEQMHPALQEVVPQEKLAEMIAKVLRDAGELKSIKFTEAQTDFSDGQRLKIYFQVRLQNKTKLAHVEFQFAGLQGHLIGFNFGPTIEQ